MLGLQRGDRSESGFIDTNKFDVNLLLNRAPVQPAQGIEFVPSIPRQPQELWVDPLPSLRREISGSERSTSEASEGDVYAGNPYQWKEVWTGQHPPTRSNTSSSREPLRPSDSVESKKRILGLPVLIFWITTSAIALCIAVGLGAGLGAGLSAKRTHACALASSNDTSAQNVCHTYSPLVAGTNTVTVLSVTTKNGEVTTISSTVSGDTETQECSTVTVSTTIKGDVSTVGGNANLASDSTSIVTSTISTTVSTTVSATVTSTVTTTVAQGASQTSNDASGSSPAAYSPCTNGWDANGQLITPHDATGSPILYSGQGQQFKIECNTNYPHSDQGQGVTDIMKVYASSMNECITYCAEYNEGYDYNTNHGKQATTKCLAVSLVVGPGQFCFLKTGTGANATNTNPPYRIDSAIWTSPG